MSQLGVIIHRPAGKPAPETAYLELALQNCSKVWGIAILADGKLDLNQGENPDLNLLTTTFEDFKDEALTIFLGDAGEGANNRKDIPPYDIIVNDDDEPLVVLFPEGNFPAFDKSGNGSSHPPSYHLAEHMSDEFLTAFDMCDKDLDKFMANIAKDNYKKKMLLHSVSRGYVTVVAQNGAVVTFAQGDTAGEIGDTWVSNTFGYGKKEEPAPVPEKKSKGMFSRSTVREKVNHQPSNNVVAAGADKVPAAATAVKAPAEGTPKPPEKKMVEALTIENVKVSRVKIPEHLPRKLRGNWIKERIGYKPNTLDDHKAEYQVYSKPDGTILTRDEINKFFGLSATKLPKLTNADPIGKNTETEHIDPGKQVSANPLPVLSPTGRERLKSYISDERVKKIIGENAALITDPDNIQGTEGKIPLFSQQMGMKSMEDFDALPFAELELIGRNTIHDLAVLCWTYKVRALSAEAKVKKAQPKGETASSATPAAAEPEVAAPRRGGMFSRKAG